MKVLLSGEGPTDLGACANAQGRCEGVDFRIGPMTILLSQLAEPMLGYALLDIPDSLQFFSETELCARTKAMPARLQPARGKKKGVETGYYFSNAMTLGHLAAALQSELDEPVLAILFRDSDGTCSSAASLWEDKFRSMQDGFLRSGFEHGVPMLPKPKSEAWLLCAASPHLPNCALLENVSGNDNAPNPAKAQLDTAFGGHKSGEELSDWVIQNPPDAERLASMRSFKAFSDVLNTALNKILH
jgi:hypothetical protein